MIFFWYETIYFLKVKKKVIGTGAEIIKID